MWVILIVLYLQQLRGLLALQSFTAAQAVDIGRQHLDRGRAETVAPGGHHAGVGIGHGFGNRGAAAAIEPDLVGQVGRAEHAVALAVRVVTGHAIGRKQGRRAGPRHYGFLTRDLRT
jgi:hypothetical protein